MNGYSHEGLEFELAAAIVQLLEKSSFQFIPKRGPPSQIVVTWAERLKTYRWGSSPEPFSDHHETSFILNELEIGCQELVSKGYFSPTTSERLCAATTRLFKWGGVTRGKGHNPPDLTSVEAVIKTSLYCADKFNAPLDSAWTKLAAFSTASISKSFDRSPQVIFDSRVSVSLLELIDSACANETKFLELRRLYLSRGLGYIPGRGGNRLARINTLRSHGWKSAYGKWTAQFIASNLVSNIVTAINSTALIDQMPTQTGINSHWDTRGVEKVLFMHGY
jgi:hypothetical protein